MLFTEIKIEHKTVEDKKEFEKHLDLALSYMGYSRASWFLHESARIINKYREDIKK